MVYGGNATVYVSNMDTAIRFYTEVLGLKLTNRFGNHWATVQAGKSLVIGLHPWRAPTPPPGTKGSVQVGLVVSQDMPIAEYAARLRRHGLEVSGVIASEAGRRAFAIEYERTIARPVDGVALHARPLERVTATRRATNRPKDLAPLPVLEATLLAKKAPPQTD